jgi:hypothetical protein
MKSVSIQQRQPSLRSAFGISAAILKTGSLGSLQIVIFT